MIFNFKYKDMPAKAAGSIRVITNVRDRHHAGKIEDGTVNLPLQSAHGSG
jgi:hypothetical protein